MKWRVSIVVPLLAVAFAGCVADDPDLDVGPEAVGPGQGIDYSLLSVDAHDVLAEVVAYIPASTDGIMLHARVHLPSGEGPWPTILQLSPYNTHSLGPTGESTAGQGLVDTYTPKGYAVVIADVRGTGNSEGCMEMMGPLERQDAHDIVEWVAAQDWSDGKVGMQGVSYVGTTPHEALVMAPEHLVTVVTVAGVTNQWRNTFMNGVPYLGRFYPITYQVMEGAPPPTDFERGAAWAINAGEGGCGQEGMIGAMRPDVYRLGVYDEYWHDRNQTVFKDDAKASILYSQGFVDRAVNPSEAVHWFNELPVPKKGFFHQAGHQYPPREDYFDTELAWFDYWLKGIENGVMDSPTVEVQLNDDRIRTGEAWPPAPDEVEMMRLYLGPQSLSPEPPADGSEHYMAGIGAQAIGLASDAEPTSLVFTTPPLDAPVHLAGESWMHLIGTVDAPHTYWLFDLYDVGPGGETWIAEGWFNAHLKDGFDESNPLTPGEQYAFDFRFEAREYIFQEGRQIELRLFGHDPSVLPIGEPVTTNTVFYGAEGSYVELPVLVDPTVWDRPEGI